MASEVVVIKFKAKAIYDFAGDSENGELNLKEGDIIEVANEDIGDGWWEGQVEPGKMGLFPESYVEREDEPNYNGYQDNEIVEDEFQRGADNRHDSFDQQPVVAAVGAGKWDEDGDDWDLQPRQDGGYNPQTGSMQERDNRESTGSPGGRNSQLARAGTVRKNINRFSPFVKTGSEGYILGHVPNKIAIKHSDKLKIVKSPEDSAMWDPNTNPFSIEVTDPEKKKKFKGIKSFMAYHVIPSSSGRGVSRRYKHYTWLHERLVDKFSMHCVPPLPDKQYYGRYGESFVEKRREKLQRWSNRIARHPILSRSDVFTHFILCDDEGSSWKAGKRRAEKDELVGSAYLQAVEHPDVSIDVAASEATVEAFGHFERHLKLSLSKMRAKFIDHCNQMSGPFMGEFHKMSSVIHGLATTCKMEDKQYSNSLTEAIFFTAETYRDIGKMHAEQPRNDMLPALDMMKEYIGLLLEFPDVVDIHRGAASKVKECDKMKEECRIDLTEAASITARSESISAAVTSEIYHFQHERVIDFREMMKHFLDEQLNFYKEIIRKLEEARSQYNDGTDL